MDKELNELKLVELLKEIHIYGKNECMLELKRRIRENVIETKCFTYYMLISQIYFVIATEKAGDNRFDNLNNVLKYDKSEYRSIMKKMPITHPSRLYFEAIDDLIESEEIYSEYISEIVIKLNLYKKQNYIKNMLDPQSEEEVNDLAENIIYAKNEIEVNDLAENIIYDKNEIEVGDKLNNNQKSEAE